MQLHRQPEGEAGERVAERGTADPAGGVVSAEQGESDWQTGKRRQREDRQIGETPESAAQHPGQRQDSNCQGAGCEPERERRADGRSCPWCVSGQRQLV